MTVDLNKVARIISQPGRAWRPISSIVSSRVRTAGKIEFVKDTGPVRRDIRVQGFNWSPDTLRNLAKILWAAERSHSYAMAALRLFSKMPSSEFSPDGLLGGRGYIQPVKEMRGGLGQAVEMLSSFTDTLHDEINADHWGSAPKAPATQELVQDAEQVKSNPEGFVENSFEGAEQPVVNPSADDMNPKVEGASSGSFFGEDEEEKEAEEPATSQHTSSALPKALKKLTKEDKTKDPRSGLPGDGSLQGEAKTIPEMVMNTTTPDHGNYASAVRKILKSQEKRLASNRRADSSLPVDTLSGPRVDHIGPAAGNEAGHFNDDEIWPSDDLLGEGFSHLNPIYEDGNNDGVTGDDNATDGDETVLKVSAQKITKVANYSWLPGSSNSKNLDYYALGLSAEDIEWMRAHSDPDPPKGMGPEKSEPDTDWLWDTTLR